MSSHGPQSGPFADLLDTPISTHMANAPAPDHAPMLGGARIPDDFNPMSMQAVSRRNTADPLGQMRPVESSETLLPEQTVDALFQPSDGSIADMTQPTHALDPSLLETAHDTDPMRVFTSESQSDPAQQTFSLVQDFSGDFSQGSYRTEMGSYFRAPRAVESDESVVTEAPSTAPLPLEAQPHADITPGDTHEDVPVAEDAWSHPMPSPQEASAFHSEPPTQELPPEPPVADERPSAAWHGTPPPAVHSPQVPSPLEHQMDTPTSSHSAELLQAFRQGAGLAQSRYPEQLTPELMALLGQLLSASMQGYVDLLKTARSHHPETLMHAARHDMDDGNPLGIMPSGTAALAQLLSPDLPGVMGGAQAVRDACQALTANSKAVASSGHAANQSLIKRLAPEAIELELEQQGSQRFMLPVQRHARLWEIHCNRYRWLRDELEARSAP